MDFRRFYARRLRYMFHFSKKNFGYYLLKILCLIVGLPLATVLFVAEMVISFVYMIFMYIPFINFVMLFICRILTTICSIGFYICILPELSQYFKECARDSNQKKQQPLLLLPASTQQQEEDEQDESK